MILCVLGLFEGDYRYIRVQEGLEKVVRVQKGVGTVTGLLICTLLPILGDGEGSYLSFRVY